MRNLYSRLSISPLSSHEEIESAMNKCNNASLRADVNAILLNPNRRQIYDQVNVAMIDIGKLRSRLGLSHALNWQGIVASEYTHQSESCSSKYEELIKKIEIAKRQIDKEEKTKSVRAFLIGWLRFAIILSLAIGIIWFAVNSTDNSSSKKPVRTLKSKPPEVAFSKPIQPNPNSGTTRIHTSEVPIAPLKIQTSIGSNYLVKLVDSITLQNTMDIFILGGDEVEVEVPLGNYIIKYASGDTWYGYEYYFGPKTSYSKAENVFKFQRIGNRLSGYTITLYTVAHGNLRTSRISPENF